jgi:competence protein ComEC
MKLPTLWIAVAFACGVVCELAWKVACDVAFVSRWLASPKLLLTVVVIAIALGGTLLWRKRVAGAWTMALIAWAAMGALAIGVERAVVPANHVARLISEGRIETSEPLRWRGRLREDPAALPWGRRYEVELESVEVAGAPLLISGGLRANLYGQQAADAPEGLRAGDRVEVLLRARPPRNFLDPGAFDLRGFLARQRIDLTGSLRSGELLRKIGQPSPTVSERLARARGNLLGRLDSLFGAHSQRAAVLRAMLLGDRSFVDSDVVTAFQKTAAYHVLVVAGLHVGALAVFLFWLCRRLRFSIGLTSLVTLIALGAYVGIVQDRPPILRAALMAALYVCARPLFRRIDLVNTVALAALAILFWKPSSLADSSFQLSFAAAGVIAGLALPWMDRTSAPYRAGLAHLDDVTRDVAHAPKIAQFRIETRAAARWLSGRLPRHIVPQTSAIITLPIRAGLRLWEIVLLSAAIQWGMMPLLAFDFHRVSLAGPLSNIPAVILTGIIVPLGFFTLALTFVWGRLAILLANALSVCAGWLLATVAWFSRWPRVSYRIPGPPLWLAIVFFGALICLAGAARAAANWRNNRIAQRGLPPPIRPAEWISAVVLAALTLAVAIHPFKPQLERGKLEVSVLDVGQGDSIFVAFPDGRTMLIDGGGQQGSQWVGGSRSGVDVGEEVVSPYLWSRGLKQLDVVALTHAHHDHLDGLHSVLENFRVGELWIGRDEKTPALESLLHEAQSRGATILHEARGAQFDWAGVTGEVLWPADASSVEEASNDDSLVLRLTDGRVSFLLPGDIQKRVEDDLAREHAPLAADFLKVPHHGSKTSSTAAFLAAVAPHVAVVSVGEGNPFGHPVESVVERYEHAGVRFLRTDRDGAVTALTDGRDMQVHAFAEQLPK